MEISKKNALKNVAFSVMFFLSGCVSSTIRIKHRLDYKEPPVQALLFVPSTRSEDNALLNRLVEQAFAERGVKLIFGAKDKTLGDGFTFEEIRAVNSDREFDGILSMEEGDGYSNSFRSYYGTSVDYHYPFRVRVFSNSLSQEILDVIIELKTSSAGGEALCKELAEETVKLFSKNRIVPAVQKPSEKER